MCKNENENKFPIYKIFMIKYRVFSGIQMIRIKNSKNNYFSNRYRKRRLNRNVKNFLTTKVNLIWIVMKKFKLQNDVRNKSNC